MIGALLAMGLAIGVALAWQNAWAPAAGAMLGLAVAYATGVVASTDLATALAETWRPLIGIIGIMLTTASAAELGVFARVAAWIEPRTRGPVKHAFRMVFAIAALTAAVLSNDAAILLLTPVVVELLRQVYPRRHPKFVLPFAFAVFVAAGVAPLPTSNPMNLVVAHRAGISFNAYALHMIPVAIVGWVVAYALLAWIYRDVLADEAPALGGKELAVAPLDRHARTVLGIAAASVAAYPILAALDLPIWPVAASAGLLSVAVALHRRVALTGIAGGVSWELVPFLFGVLVLATAIARAGVTAQLASLYETSGAPLVLIGSVAAGGSAVIGNHPMALLHSLALEGQPDTWIYAALIGGDLGPRLLPIGSLAGLLWIDALRRQGVRVPLSTFIGVGFIVTVPSLIVSLGLLRLIAGA